MTDSLPAGDEQTNKRTITIEVRGGVVVDVYNLPEGWDYTLLDHDNEAGEML